MDTLLGSGRSTGPEGHRRPGVYDALGAHPAPILFHKGDLTDGEALGLAQPVRQALADSKRRVVGVVLNALDETDTKGPKAEALGMDLPLFAALTAPPPPEPVAEPVPESLRALEEAVKRLNPDDMTPKEALDALYSLRDVHKPDL